MEKRVILAMLLSVVVLALYQTFLAPPPPVQPPVAATDAGATSSTAQPGLATVPGAPAGIGQPVAPAGMKPAPAAPAVPVAAPIVADAAARDVVVDADAFVATFNSAGAVLTSWKLKQYLDPAGQPLELVPPPTATSGGPLPRPFTLGTDDAAQSVVLATALYKPSAEGLTLGKGSGTLRFQYQDASGLTAQKAFYFQPDGRAFVVNVEAAVEVSGAAKPVTLHWGPAIGLFDPAVTQTTPPRVVQFHNGSVARITASSFQPPAASRFEGALRFAGVEDHYFVTAAVPGDMPVRVDYVPVFVPVPGATAGETHPLVAFSISPKTEGSPSRTVTIPFFMGPKDFDRLKEVDKEFVRAIDFGMFAWLVVPLLRALKWLNTYIHNFGWSIIALTVLINIAIFPLRHRSMVSMRKMQTLQPQVKAIQERYKKYKFTDPERQKMNTEMMGLYKQHGVSPASGCVPMLLTMPVLFAFYAMLSVAIELRGAPFLGWIHDLAAKDPTYFTPILMGGTMFWQQRMMPTTADPVQQKVFLFMPLIFTAMFLTMPSGLVVYWTASNLLTIGQQYLTNHLIGAPGKPRPPRKAQP